MLQIKSISKQYKTGDLVQIALSDVCLNFRDNEFVSVLGPSGSGKTTLLNIVGGLDRYDSGDLIINNVSTKFYKDRDWDSYRNHTIGFVFQSYNLIPHQTVLANVELALTIGGISKKERRKRALEALDQVGLKEQAHKRPNQMSGGQMQRVAIARALVNNPDILLADEPTGALDTETSLQVMELLKQVANDRLVIMVTHNPELAEAYSNRIVRLKDGKITGDTNPFFPEKEAEETPKHRNLGKASMSIGTALSLSFNNLLTKKTRTLLTSFAGSIGIIGIALILSLSTGFQNYIDQIQEDTLTSYPLTITSETADTTSLLLSMVSETEDEEEGSTVKEQQNITNMFSKIGSNDLAAFKKYLEDQKDAVGSMASLVDYQYSVEPLIYTVDVTDTLIQVNPSTILSSMGFKTVISQINSAVFNEMLDDRQSLKQQYAVLSGRWPESFDEMMLVLPSENSITDLMLYSLGLRDGEELKDMMTSILAGEAVKNNNSPLEYTYEELMAVKYKLVNAADTYKYNSKYGIYEDMSGDMDYMEDIYEDALELKIVGIVCEKEGTTSANLSPGIAYMKELTEYVIEQAADSEIVKKQLADEDVDVFSGKGFDEADEQSGLDFSDMISVDTDALSQALGMTVSESDIRSMTQGYMEEVSASMTADTESAETDFQQVLVSLGVNLIKQYAEQYGSNLAGTAVLDAEDVDEIVSDYMDSEEAGTLLETLTVKYPVPAETFASVYTECLKGMLQASISLAPADPQNPANGVLTEEMAEPLMDQLLSREEIVNLADQMGTAMTEARMQKEVLTKVGELSGELVETMASSFHVDEAEIASAFHFDLSEEELDRLMTAMTSSSEEKNAASNLTKLGYQDLEEPTSIAFYFEDFESKESFMNFLDEYNETMEVSDDEKVIKYTDITGTLMSSVKTIVDSVSYVLIAFVSISLVVSSIMIGIITYISVLERTKEIGVLRAIGASKKNISSIFNAETFIVGFCAGLLGIFVTLACIPPINYVIHSLTGNPSINAVLPLNAAIVLVMLSIILTLIGGLIPSRQAAKKDPVLALRSE